MTDFPAPEPTPLSAPYFEALADGRLIYPRCGSCRHAWLPVLAECPNCLAADWQWQTACGRGKIISWVVYHIAYHEAFADRLPYNVAIVELEEGPRLITNISGVKGGEGLKIEHPVVLSIDSDHGVPLARFRLA